MLWWCARERFVQVGMYWRLVRCGRLIRLRRFRHGRTIPSAPPFVLDRATRVGVPHARRMREILRGRRPSPARCEEGSHLKEIADYYSRLSAMEAEAETDPRPCRRRDACFRPTMVARGRRRPPETQHVVGAGGDDALAAVLSCVPSRWMPGSANVTVDVCDRSGAGMTGCLSRE